MLTHQDPIIAYDSGRCTRCGTCLASCPVDALRLTEGRDVFDITVDHATCIGCLKCVGVCPAATLPERPLRESDFATMRRALLACASDVTQRHKATSGGVARTLARAALASKWVDAVYCAVQRNDEPYAEGAFLTSIDEIDRVSNSVYCAFPFNRNLRMKHGGQRLKRVLYIGTNCQIQAAERFFRDSGVDLIKVGIICKQQKTRGYVRWARRMLKQKADDTTPIRYRGYGWPGRMTSGAATYQNYFRPFSMELWRVPGCRFCPHALGDGSDVLLADPWKLISTTDGNPGLTMTLLRTDRALALWNIATPYLTEDRELTAADVQISIDWKGYQKKQARISYFLGLEASSARRLFYRFIENQRYLYEWLISTFPVPEIIEKLLNRTLKK